MHRRTVTAHLTSTNIRVTQRNPSPRYRARGRAIVICITLDEIQG